MHGIKTNILTAGTRPIAAAATAIIGLVGTAPAADNAMFPVGARVLVTNIRRALSNIGATGTLPAALAAIADQADATVVLVRVAPDPNAGAQDTNTIAGVNQLLGAEMALGFRPRIIGAPGLDTAAVASALVVVAKKLRGMVYARAIGNTVNAASNYAAQFGDRELMLIWPNFTGSFAGDAVARAIGLRAQIDEQQGWHKTLSNVVVAGVSGIAQDVSFDFEGGASDATTLNAAGITTLVRFGGGFRFWGNRTRSDEPLFAFESATRTSQIIADEIAYGLAWAQDKPMTARLVRDVLDTINARLRKLVSTERLIGAKAWYDPALNSATDLAAGKLVIDYDFTPAAPLEGLELNQRITDRYYADLASQIAA
ncbi:phage tail sheath subtilisin-like domain-containing protein [Novosphingobium huizhouense]|uniref:phage tail sheath subtilisin-like domain-containing protein n=1 Tax=Novosphingobium huizhouense TaxID=2866625 RepID=UPI001CD83B90|nr:phage tail sheath subtilisin-like domain-containing protein [Novosphingobium huizhouense]